MSPNLAHTETAIVGQIVARLHKVGHFVAQVHETQDRRRIGGKVTIWPIGRGEYHILGELVVVLDYMRQKGVRFAAQIGQDDVILVLLWLILLLVLVVNVDVVERQVARLIV